MMFWPIRLTWSQHANVLTDLHLKVLTFDLDRDVSTSSFDSADVIFSLPSTLAL